MPELTRRRSPDAREECWHVYYGDVHAGTWLLDSRDGTNGEKTGNIVSGQSSVATRANGRATPAKMDGRY
jgi:hypothetical protein